MIQIIFVSIFCFYVISRYLQSEFTSHEKLNRVKNIFKNCRQILLNNNNVKNVLCNDINKQQIVKKFEHLQIRQQNSQLLINDKRNYL